MDCIHCRESHGDIVCNCGHSHSEHVIGIGCKIKEPYCCCEQYSQTGLRKYGETHKQFYNRTGKKGNFTDKEEMDRSAVAV